MLNLGFKTLNDLYKTSASDTFVKSLSLLIFIFESKDISLNPFKTYYNCPFNWNSKELVECYF